MSLVEAEKMKKLLVVQVAALGAEFLSHHRQKLELADIKFKPIQTVFPAVTCTVQASFRTGQLPNEHGMVGNGFFSRELRKPMFWEQSSNLINGDRIWDRFRENGGTVGMVFWQQSLGTRADVILSPAPIHKHHGGIIQDLYSRPAELHWHLTSKIGRSFNLADYWGPKASIKSSEWIVEATRQVMESPSPDLLLTYLPHLDYELQRSGPRSNQSAQTLEELNSLLKRLLSHAKSCDYQFVIFGDYAMHEVRRPIFPNRILLQEGYLRTRRVKAMLYPDFHTSSAFAVVDHQIAHVITSDEETKEEVEKLFGIQEGVSDVLRDTKKREYRIDHPRAGDLVLVSEPDSWFAYPWWEQSEAAPEYASHVDIHNKPGYDPCELFWGLWPISVCSDASRICGSHGLAGPDNRVVYGSSFDLPPEGHLTDLSNYISEELLGD